MRAVGEHPPHTAKHLDFPSLNIDLHQVGLERRQNLIKTDHIDLNFASRVPAAAVSQEVISRIEYLLVKEKPTAFAAKCDIMRLDIRASIERTILRKHGEVVRVRLEGDYSASRTNHARKQHSVEAKIGADIKGRHPRANNSLQGVPFGMSNAACAMQAQIEPAIERGGRHALAPNPMVAMPQGSAIKKLGEAGERSSTGDHVLAVGRRRQLSEQPGGMQRRKLTGSRETGRPVRASVKP